MKRSKGRFGTTLMAVVLVLAVGGTSVAESNRISDDKEVVEKVMKLLEERLAERNADIRKEIEEYLSQLLSERDETPGDARDQEVSDNEVWSFLAERHDKNRDGKVTPEEYDRGETQYARLDRDEDGVLTVADFEGGGGMRNMRRQMRAMYMDSNRMAPRVLHRYFQESAEGEEETLTRAALETALGAYDTNGNKVIERAEFAKESELRGARAIEGVEEYDRYKHLLAVADGDKSETLTFEEFFAYFAEKDTDGDLQLASAEVGRSTGRGRGMSADPSTWSGPAVGEMAPDFALGTYLGGDEKVTLSSFRGEKPVALIFGSYT